VGQFPGHMCSSKEKPRLPFDIDAGVVIVICAGLTMQCSRPAWLRSIEARLSESTIGQPAHRSSLARAAQQHSLKPRRPAADCQPLGGPKSASPGQSRVAETRFGNAYPAAAFKALAEDTATTTLLSVHPKIM